MTGKPERQESRNDRKAEMTGKPERQESRNDRKAETAGKRSPCTNTLEQRCTLLK